MNLRMKSTKKKIIVFLAVLLLTALACNFGGGSEVIPTTAPPTLVPPTAANTLPTATVDNSGQVTPPTQPPSGAGLSGGQRERLASSTVLIIMSDLDGDRFVPFGIGSGTILSPDGFILTNAHVAKPSARGFGDTDPEVLIVALNEDVSRPPVPTYLAEVRAVDGFLDLAVIQITSFIDGSRVTGGSLNLPYVDIGNSDEIGLGDNIHIFGFPGIGGETITFTKGSVAGFSSEDPVGDRAWIKTDATIAGGNSGGLAANDFAQIIGVPTRGGSGTENDIADCRVVQDTNGDGILDQNDTCIPIGGFINSLRPVNLAVPLIRAAQTGVAYESPYQTGGGQTGVVGTGNEQFIFLVWSEQYEEASGCGTGPVASFASGVDQVSAIFQFAGMTDGEPFGLYWLIDEEIVVDNDFPWEYGPDAPCFPFFIHNGGEALPDGEYTLLLYAGEGLPLVAETSTTVGGSGSGGGTGGAGLVYVEGRVTDSDTGNPIAGAAVVILTPGVDVDDWLDNGTDDQVLAWAETDSNGYYAFANGFQRGVEYPALSGASSQGYFTKTGSFLFTDADPDQITIDIELNK